MLLEFTEILIQVLYVGRQFIIRMLAYELIKGIPREHLIMDARMVLI